MKGNIVSVADQCSGCGYCRTVCPAHAIEMTARANGFIYPIVHEQLCTGCQICYFSCPSRNDSVFRRPRNAYALINHDKGSLMKSSSGGAFVVFAQQIILEGGYVCGCIWDSNFKATHMVTNSAKNLLKMQGSKYVQSDISDVFEPIKALTHDHHTVLFCGTPCQVDAVRESCGADNDCLLTVDIICHGVSSPGFFASFLKYTAEKAKLKELTDFVFRDKEQGWSFDGKMEGLDWNDRHKIKRFSNRLISYYSLYLDAETYRDCCYSCKYARNERISDITIGDFWGAEKEQKKNNGLNDVRYGVSLVLVNTENGVNMLRKIEGKASICSVRFSDAAKQNEPLNHPSVHTDFREEVNSQCTKDNEMDWASVEELFEKRLGKKKYLFRIWQALPSTAKNLLRNVQRVMRKST